MLLRPRGWTPEGREIRPSERLPRTGRLYSLRNSGDIRNRALDGPHAAAFEPLPRPGSCPSRPLPGQTGASARIRLPAGSRRTGVSASAGNSHSGNRLERHRKRHARCRLRIVHARWEQEPARSDDRSERSAFFARTEAHKQSEVRLFWQRPSSRAAVPEWPKWLRVATLTAAAGSHHAIHACESCIGLSRFFLTPAGSRRCSRATRLSSPWGSA